MSDATEIHWKQDVRRDITDAEELIKLHIMDIGGGILVQSVLVHFIICLHDLLHKSREAGNLISFTDDLVLEPDIRHVTDMVSVFRGAACHISSGNNKIEDTQARVVFGRQNGLGVLARIGEHKLVSEFPDDIAFFCGHRRLYYRRQMIRAFEEAKAFLIPLTGYPPHFFK